MIFLFLGFSDWYGHNWHLTVFTKIMLVGATITAFMYCLAVIFLPDYFTYNGTTAIFMSINFIFATLLIFLQVEKSTVGETTEKFVKVDILVKTFIEKDIFSAGVQDEQQKLKEVMQSVSDQNQSYLRYVKMIILAAYFASLIPYFVIIISQNPKDQKLVGLTNVALVVTSDLM